MAKQVRDKKKPASREQRKVRTQQIFFGILAAILIISWILSLVINV